MATAGELEQAIAPAVGKARLVAAELEQAISKAEASAARRVPAERRSRR